MAHNDLWFVSEVDARQKLGSMRFAVRHPVFPATRAAVQHSPIGPAIADGGHYAVVPHDHDREVQWFAWNPVAPFIRLWFWWTQGTWVRFAIERALRGRVIDKPEGERWTDWTWKIRPLSKWTRHRTRA